MGAIVVVGIRGSRSSGYWWYLDIQRDKWQGEGGGRRLSINIGKSVCCYHQRKFKSCLRVISTEFIPPLILMAPFADIAAS